MGCASSRNAKYIGPDGKPINGRPVEDPNEQSPSEHDGGEWPAHAAATTATPAFPKEEPTVAKKQRRPRSPLDPNRQPQAVVVEPPAMIIQVEAPDEIAYVSQGKITLPQAVQAEG